MSAQIADAKARAIRQWFKYVDYQLHDLALYYPQNEVLTWPIAKDEALTFIEQGVAGPYLVAAAEASGLDVDDLADTILQNALDFAAAAGALVGKRIYGVAEIKAARTLDGVQDVLDGLMAGDNDE